ncbi:hypothetical protein TNCV_756741 [Trichonephila clavipes]|nr:hypothetical protein TNCV_756741 [Trichonephila clavipes]
MSGIIRQVTGTPIIQFQSLIPRPKTHTRLTFGAPARISDLDCPSRNTPETKFSSSKTFNMSPCHGMPTIWSSGIIRKSYGYVRDPIQKSDSTPQKTPDIHFSYTFVNKIRFQLLAIFCKFSRFPNS